MRQCFCPPSSDDISVDFLNYLETELDGQLCTQTLLELYQIYKRYVIQYKIMDLVPSRPELEFPETMAMTAVSFSTSDQPTAAKHFTRWNA